MVSNLSILEGIFEAEFQSWFFFVQMNFKRDFLYNQKGRRSIAGTAQELQPTPAWPPWWSGGWVGVPEPSPLSTFYLFGYKGNPFKKIFWQKKTLKFGLKNTLQDRQVRDHFFKNSLQEGIFENSWKFFQLLQNFKPTRKLLCTFLY